MEDLKNVDTAVVRLMTMLHANALRTLLRNPQGRAAFEAFLAKEASTNNLYFYDAVNSLLDGGGTIKAGEIVDK